MFKIISKAIIIIIMFYNCSANAIYNKNFLKTVKSGTIVDLAREFKKRTTLELIPASIGNCHLMKVSATNQFNTKTIELVNSKNPLLKISYSYNFNFDSNDVWKYTFTTRCSEKNGYYKTVIYLY